MSKVSDLINKSDWHNLVNQYEPKDVARDFTFKEERTVAYKMLFNEERDDDLRDYAAQLLQELRQAYPEEWLLDWKNEIFLGDACYMTMRFEEQYEAYKRAYDKANPVPSSLLLSLAGCYLSPQSPITLDEAENLTKKALEKEMSREGVVLLRGIYAEKKDQTEFDYWDKFLQEMGEEKINTQDVWPDFSNIHS